jgi:hypothetical protein
MNKSGVIQRHLSAPDEIAATILGHPKPMDRPPQAAESKLKHCFILVSAGGRTGRELSNSKIPSKNAYRHNQV